MESPKNLAHCPIISVNNYNEIDSIYTNNSDAKALSIGNAQFNNKEISLKVWRHNGKKWSRQSEELPIHRNLDLNILFLAAILTDINSNYPRSILREKIVSPAKVQEIKDYYSINKHFLEPRLKELKNLLNEIL